ncbi:MAG: methylated-DNA--[Synergistaceae bacterium]|nr:methylated-DNA--[protein]-cysteine S-methyltransferase [Synergistaceae bacterium]
MLEFIISALKDFSDNNLYYTAGKVFKMIIDRSIYDSPLGKILLQSTEAGLFGLNFYNKDDFADSGSKRKNNIIDSAKRWLDIYFSGKEPDFTPPIDAAGTEFYHKVWKAVQEIPRGQTMTYHQIAEKLNCRCALPIGRALADNKVLIIIPCHRVIGSNGDLRGYSGGLERKIKLLSLEGVKIEVREKHFVS